MKIVLATPLYPPDIAEPAPYVKELARRLSSQHQITIVAYGNIPEKIHGVVIVPIDKQRPLPIRLILFTFALWRVARNADIVYTQNGPSVELPSSIVSTLARRPLVMRFGDIPAHEHAGSNLLLNIIERFAIRCARTVIEDSPLPRPEILPFEPQPTDALAVHEKSWNSHVVLLNNVFKTYARK